MPVPYLHPDILVLTFVLQGLMAHSLFLLTFPLRMEKQARSPLGQPWESHASGPGESK